MPIKKKVSEATKARQRVLIAKDVLYRLRTKKIEARSGTYFKLKEGYLEPREDLQKLLEPKDVTCVVCAIGAVFVSGVFQFDSYRTPAWLTHGSFRLGRESMTRFLRKFFLASQLNLMEAAFEGFQANINQRAAGMAFSRYEDDSARLRAIFMNIIRNKGTFKIPAKFIEKAKQYAL